MSPIDDARAHLSKAKEFLAAAEFDLDLELFNAAASNAVISGINAKDAVCLRLTGSTAKSENHTNAVAELRAAGGTGNLAAATKQLATVLGRLLRLKSKSQYQSVDVARTEAFTAVEWAQRMVDGAAVIVSS